MSLRQHGAVAALFDEPAASAIRVVSIPANHPYVVRMTAADVTVLPDPTPPGAAPGQWWPPVALDAAWIDAHADDADLLHIHFGTESLSLSALRDCLEAARRVGWPIVYTVHDLEHPQLSDQLPYSAQLDLLVGEADAIVTLTEGAAAEVSARWGRTAVVIPHPRLLADDVALPTSVPRGPARMGVHLKDLRPNVDAEGTVRSAIAAVAELNQSGVEASLELRMHSNVRDPSEAAAVRALASSSPYATLIEHERLGDAELAAALDALDVCILPYRYGTHSGWLELCWDLAVAVASPDLGHYRDQHPDGSVALFTPGSAGQLAASIRSLLDLTNPETARSGTTGRTELRDARLRSRRGSDTAAAERQAHLYRDLLDQQRVRG